MDLRSYRTLGRSGLIVSPLALGTMTFGTPRWGSADDVSEQVFDAYVDAGGTFLDTADTYAKGRSEELLGRYVAARGLRDHVVLATKFTWNAVPGVPTTSGNGRKNIRRALEGSLRRLNTDFIDLYWLHHWDLVTPVEEVVQTLGDLVRAGQIHHYGFSNVPAWYAAQAAILAQVHGVPGPIALQLEYSLTERGLEREHASAAQHLGLGITPWSPLGAGFLTGKYRRAGEGAASGEGRLSGPNPFGNAKFTEKNWRTLDALHAVAADLGRPPAQVALAWVSAQPGVTAPIFGASRVAQVHDAVASLEITLSAEHLRALDDASALEPSTPASLLQPGIRRMIFGGAEVAGWDEQQTS
ncbi:aryl-alcohol dehydrogenase-like predicted oxidoreductase [Deinococcus metalli]|uniref:Aldo/keto reductase n=1 Tax=Deinococcus metalli TaxID=1141878 RepID=A0A7W8KI87_9DEIO|nr:aldo/keto reductase [Deinococcus metalli]MBB5377521.1 aryl-alcohol dehydrogenase-like predicted oxidoreductase [Deinococcus metalli]GHF51069.1 aldo/keto reductase [Deinococcus metalli]